MADVIEIPDAVNGYVDLVNTVYSLGEEVSPRGKKTLEIEDATIVIKDIYNTLPIGVGRGIVNGIGAVEACQLLAGVSEPELVVKVGPQFANYREDNGIFHGAYGLRTKGQYHEIINRLKADPDTRQAIVTIWNPEYDLLPNKRDYPCTILHQFRIRNNKLNMSVYMRSNDVWLGAAYDFFQFTRVQIAIASVLGIEPGTYAHHVGSLHLYEEHWASVEKLHHIKKKDYTHTAPIIGQSWLDVQLSAMHCLIAADTSSPLGEHRNSEHSSPGERWNIDAMQTAIEKNNK